MVGQWRNEETGGEMINNVKTQRLLLGRITQGNMKNSTQRRECGTWWRRRVKNREPSDLERMDGQDSIGRSQSEVGASVNRNTPLESSDCD